LRFFDKTYSLQPVFLTAAEKASFYHGFSNEIIWPLFHGLPSRCRFSSEYWNGYSSANEKFAAAVERIAQPHDFIWVHDYHLMMQAQVLRARGMRQHLAYFQHIPFPAPDVFEHLPWREEILRALMQFDSIGFQTGRDRNNFVACLTRWLPELEGQDAITGTYPISVDFESLSTEASQRLVSASAESVRRKLGTTRMILGIDRLDYTKGIPERLCAFQTLLERRPEWRGKVTFLQFVVPSREAIPEYKELRKRIENSVSKINGQHSIPGWVPVHYFYRSIAHEDLMTLYRAADVALVTPLKDGMNLVAKEFCAARPDLQGVLILSEFAGAADELKCGALIVNPHDAESLASALQTAFQMPEHERRTRMQAMRSHIRTHDVFYWANSFKIFDKLASTSTLDSAGSISQIACNA
jgi:trehalose 6-phosphate synthase